MHRAVLAAALSLSLIAVAGAPAVAQKPPPPPKKDADCSPGYYKNHPETWAFLCPDGIPGLFTCEQLLAMLNATGAGAGTLKNIAAAALNSVFGSAEDSPCTDD
jgi:hypothetical protein